ncbi:hypothetical protein ACIQTZ_07470 [Paenarthrobacter sp. NPDC090520]|uniref:hypothetical protein n=1 Tax=Paenarthrobacter sp. NPDC090520 TaxID=3364382 RepID=UPI0037F781F9
MKAIRVFPRGTRILRSVMIAGAGTAVWMALSAAAATADSGNQDNHSLLGGITSSVASTSGSLTAQTNSTLGATTEADKETRATVTKVVAPKAPAATVQIPLPAIPLPAPIKAIVPASTVTVDVPAVTPVIQQVAASTDKVVSTVPVVAEVAPSGTVGGVVDAIATPVAETVDHKVETVIPPVNEAIKPVALEPVTNITKPIVQPIVDIVDPILPPVNGTVPPVAGPGTGVPSLPGGEAPVVLAEPDAGTLPPSAVVSSPEAATPAASAEKAEESWLAAEVSSEFRPSGPLQLNAAQLSRTVGTVAGTTTSTDDETPLELPGDPEGAPLNSNGSGSGSSQNGPPSPAAAYLGGEVVIPSGSISGLASVSTEQHPKPVSFDPGSSPD